MKSPSYSLDGVNDNVEDYFLQGIGCAYGVINTLYACTYNHALVVPFYEVVDEVNNPLDCNYQPLLNPYLCLCGDALKTSPRHVEHRSKYVVELLVDLDFLDFQMLQAVLLAKQLFKSLVAVGKKRQEALTDSGLSTGTEQLFHDSRGFL